MLDVFVFPLFFSFLFFSFFLQYVYVETYSRFYRFPLCVLNNFVILSLSLSPEYLDVYLPYFADFVCCKDLDSNSFCFVLKMYSSLPQLFVFLFDVWSVAVFVIRDRFVKKTTADMCLNLYPCVIKYSLSLSLSPSNLTYSGRSSWFVLY